ncbi:MAG: glycoside hydrolase family 5 protein [Bacteroidales bacterium]|nr:glycoside hydrolase family 5 protein [Bacteroidales bacterium]
MKKSFLFAASVAAMMAMAGCGSAPKADADSAAEQKTEASALEFARTMGIGWNLGNNMDAYLDGVANETCWHDQPATQATFDRIKSIGFHSVRIPITWMGHIGAAPDYKIDGVWMDRVAELVEMAQKAGLIALINIHHDGFGDQKNPELKKHHWLDVVAASKDSTVNANTEAKLAAVWGQIAARFKDTPADCLVFETLNEIQDGNWGNGSNTTDGGAQYATLNHWNQVAVDAIRAAGGQNAKRYIGIPGYVTSPHLTIDHLQMPKDEAKDRIMVAVHSYDPWDYAGSAKYSEWGHTGKDVAPGADENTYTGMLDALCNKYIKNGIPVYLGEFGAVNRADDHAEAFRKYYLEYVVKAMSDRNIAAFYWDNGYALGVGDESFGLFNHQTGEYFGDGEEVGRLMVKAYDTKDSSYTLQSIYNRAPAAK